jgi:Zn finger protein HypA/HybF involved in hydrogenase expression
MKSIACNDCLHVFVSNNEHSYCPECYSQDVDLVDVDAENIFDSEWDGYDDDDLY